MNSVVRRSHLAEIEFLKHEKRFAVDFEHRRTLPPSFSRLVSSGAGLHRRATAAQGPSGMCKAQVGVSAGDVRERRLAKFRQNVARFRLYRLRFLQENMRFAAFFKIYKII